MAPKKAKIAAKKQAKKADKRAAKKAPKPAAKAAGKAAAQSPLNAIGGELVGLVDDVRVRLHLAGMDVRSSWDELSKQAFRLSKQIEQAGKDSAKAATDEARLRAHLAAMEAKEQWQHLQPQLTAVASSLQKVGEEALAGLRALPTEQAKLQATLAQMNAADELEKRKNEARAQLHKAKNAAEKLVKDTAQGIRSALKDLRAKVSGA